MIQFTLPLRVPISCRKYFALNINTYRNAHYHVCDRAKKTVADQIYAQVRQCHKIEGQAKVIATLYKADKRRMDLSNVCSIVDKFACDAIVNLGLLEDDDCEHIPCVEYRYGGIDIKYPRVDVVIRPL